MAQQTESGTILFEFQEEARFQKLEKFCKEMALDQRRIQVTDTTVWPAYFDLRALCNFSWPHEEELEYVSKEWFDWLLVWMHDLSLLEKLCQHKGPYKTAWDLLSLIETLKLSPIQLLGCRKKRDRVGQLEYVTPGKASEIPDFLRCLITVFEGQVMEHSE